uniref:Uncharacterized protein n=1 Tax=Photinus pyralis TaxID=7054 RepID=A0A1Y1MYI0_PHOPY
MTEELAACRSSSCRGRRFDIAFLGMSEITDPESTRNRMDVRLSVTRRRFSMSNSPTATSLCGVGGPSFPKPWRMNMGSDNISPASQIDYDTSTRVQIEQMWKSSPALEMASVSECDLFVAQLMCAEHLPPAT